MITLIIVEIKTTQNKVYETIIYSALAFVATMVFVVLTHFYKYVEEHETKQNLVTTEENELKNLDTKL